jgi:signal transduction histidine kinase
MMSRALAAVLVAIVCGGVVPAQAPLEKLQNELPTATGPDRVRVLNEMARATQANAPQESLEYARQALDLARQIRDRKGEIDSLNNVGIGHYYLADYNQALTFYTECLELSEQIEYDEGIAKALNNIGVLHFVWGDLDRTLEHYSSALEIHQRIGDRLGAAKAYNNLGNVYYEAERYEESLRYYAESLTLYEELEEERYVAGSLDNIGLVYYKLEQYDEALVRFERARHIEERIDNKAGLAFSLNNIGMIHGERGEHRTALEFYRRSLEVREEIGDRLGAAICRVNLGLSYAELGEPGLSLDYLRNALREATEIDVREVQRDAHLGLSGTYSLMGNHAGALESYKQYKELNDALFNEQTSHRLSELQTRYEVEHKDREIEVLRKNQEIQRIVRNVTLAGSVLLLLIVVLLYNRYRLRDRANREMRKANEAQRMAQEEREKALRAELAQVSRVATLGELATTLAHELNQPLTAILSNAQAAQRFLANDRGDREELDGALGDIVEGSDRARKIIQRLRDLIRRGEIAREPLNINAALRGVETFARAEAERRGIALVMDLHSELPVVSGDRIQLQQVLLNLVANGAEAMRGTAGDAAELIVRTSRQDPDAVLVSVQDAHGHGLAHLLDDHRGARRPTVGGTQSRRGSDGPVHPAARGKPELENRPQDRKAPTHRSVSLVRPR